MSPTNRLLTKSNPSSIAMILSRGARYLSAWIAALACISMPAFAQQVFAPVFSPAPGVYTSAQPVSITSSTSGATIRYTLDGSTPSETQGTVYSGPVTIGSTATLSAIAYKSGLTDSPVTSGSYTIQTGSAWGGTPYVTTYSYDLLNHLTQVSMTRSSGTQTRTFNYTSGTTVGVVLLSATNPENGTVNYTYNTDMTLATKTDAKGQVFGYSYDSYKRLTQVSVGATVLRNYVYDSNPDDSNYSQYAAGRLTEIKYPAISYSATVGGQLETTTFTDMFSYHQAGAVVGKRLRVTKTNPYQQGSQWLSQPGQGDLNLAYTYNNEGRPTQIVYPFDSGSGTSPTYNYTYDAMMRLGGMTTNDGGTGVSNVSYGPANQLLTMNYYGSTETRSYNNLLQLTNITATVQGGTGINVTYNYPTGSNNGKVSSASDTLSGETVAYQYDSLNRLISAAGSGWSQTQSYDGFGNLTGRVGTGTAQSTSMSTPADATTNRLSGYSYDANGNQLSTGNVFDAENRLAFANISGGMVEYFYDAQNKRVWQGTCTLGGNCQQGVVSTDTVTLFGADGRQVGTYQWSAAWTNTQTQVAIAFQASARRAYFGGKLVAQMAGGVVTSAVEDRLGSVGRYYPYGEERNSPPLANDQVKFATYTRDSGTGLDYADQRYYASTFGRFMTTDRASASPMNPTTWNRYAYVEGDPANGSDPTGELFAVNGEVVAPMFAVGLCAGDGLWDSGDPCGTQDGGGASCGAEWFQDGSLSGPCSDPCSGSSFLPVPNPGPFCPGEPTGVPTPPPQPAEPDCTIQVYNRPIETTHGLNIPGAQHGYIVFTDANGSGYIFEGKKAQKQIRAVDTSSDQGPALRKDNPFKDHPDGILIGPQVCDWLTVLQNDAANVNGTNVRYHWYGPNSSSVLRYMLQSLPDQSWYQMPWMIGYGSLLPGIETP